MPTDDEEDDGGSQHPFNDTGSPPRSPTGRARDSAARDSARDSAAEGGHPDDSYDPDLDEPYSESKGNGKGRGNGEALMRVSRITGFMAKPAHFDGTGPDRFVKLC